MKKYTVYINKIYFPRELWPKKFTDAFETITIGAYSRTDAAKRAWTKYGQKWLEQMSPKETSVRCISLNVNEPSWGTGGFAGRLTSVRVYKE